jgi:Ca2+-binding EF-hand superfamily protein
MPFIAHPLGIHTPASYYLALLPPGPVDRAATTAENDNPPAGSAAVVPARNVDELSRAFAVFDTDGSKSLDFGEFLALQPTRVRDAFGVAEIRTWYDMADTDGDGELSIDEYFAWSLNAATLEDGIGALESAFELYDTDSNGKLDALEFKNACKDMGFGGQAAHELFHAIDRDGTGNIDYREIVDSLAASSPVEPETKVMISAFVRTLACERVDQPKKKRLNTKHWSFKGATPASVQQELRALLRRSGGFVADLIRLFDEQRMSDEDTGGPLRLRVSERDFRRCMVYELGFRGKQETLGEIFSSLDLARTGEIGFDELYEWIKGRRHSLDPRAKAPIRLELELPARISMDQVVWDVEVLRVLMADMFKRFRASPADLLQLWRCTNGRGMNRRGLSREDFLALMRESFFSLEAAHENFKHMENLWVHEVQLVVGATFDRMMQMIVGENFLQRITIVHLQRWFDDALFAEHCLSRGHSHHKYTAQSLPVKSATQQKRQQARCNKQTAEELAEASAMRVRQIDWVEQAQSAIEAAKKKATAQLKARSKSEEERREQDKGIFIQYWVMDQMAQAADAQTKKERAWHGNVFGDSYDKWAEAMAETKGGLPAVRSPPGSPRPASSRVDVSSLQKRALAKRSSDWWEAATVRWETDKWSPRNSLTWSTSKGSVTHSTEWSTSSALGKVLNKPIPWTTEASFLQQARAAYGVGQSRPSGATALRGPTPRNETRPTGVTRKGLTTPTKTQPEVQAMHLEKSPPARKNFLSQVRAARKELEDTIEPLIRRGSWDPWQELPATVARIHEGVRASERSPWAN